MSFIFYVVLAVLCGLLAYRAEQTGQKKYVWLLLAVLTVVSGFRASGVGIDTERYLEKFGYLLHGRFDLVYGLEGSFMFLSYLVLQLVPSVRFLLLLLAFLTNWCIITRFWELRKLSSFSCMVLCYYMSFYFTTMNCVRQFCAVAIIFYCTRFLEQKKIIHFAVGVLLAVLLHRSAVIGLALLVIYYVQWKELPKWQKRLGIAAAAVIVLLLPVLGFLLSRYAKYLSEITVDIGWMLPLKLVFLLGSLLIVLAIRRKCPGDYLPEAPKGGERFVLLTTCVSYGAALLLGMLGYLYSDMDRISWYFFLFEGVYFGSFFKWKKRPKLLIAFAAFVIGYGFLYSLLHNSQGQMPYGFLGLN